ncbi:Semaphorin-7A [Acipenser ruthenus]|uniref:Semaphorin-7A n=1 Tax=Acipenser ruthenus TaxID=7906 RepID=A0A444UI15_ACIRT|nr:Semaphorin-7A [Acipenser ruthenus]
MISDRHYRKIQVDRVTVPGQKPHNVLLLATVEHYRSQRGNPEDQELKSIAPLSAPYFLTCPITSHHASHFWHHNNRTIDCQFSKSDCLHLIEGMKPDLYGKYQCFAEEKGYQRLVTEYTLVPSSGTTALSSKVQALGSIILLVGLIL